MERSNRHREGLEWDEGFDLTPCWARQPDLDAVIQVCRRVLGLAPEDYCSVAFHAEGAFNKLYLVPVPNVIAFDDSRDINEIGFEWILMELIPGVSALTRWRKMSMDDKISLVEQNAELQSQLFRRSVEDSKFQSMGTLGSDNSTSESAVCDPKPGRIVSHIFWGDHFEYDIPRGPFRSSHDWLSAYLGIICHEQAEILKNDDDEDTREDAEEWLRVATKLTVLLPTIFPPLARVGHKQASELAPPFPSAHLIPQPT